MYMRDYNPNNCGREKMSLPPTYGGSMYAEDEDDPEVVEETPKGGEEIRNPAASDETFLARRRGYRQRGESHLYAQASVTQSEEDESRPSGEIFSAGGSDVQAARIRSGDKRDGGLWSLIKGIGKGFDGDDILIAALLLMLLNKGEENDMMLILALLFLLI